MEKQRVLLVCMSPLLAEGLLRIFQGLEDVQVFYLDRADPVTIETCMRDIAPSTVILAGERADDAATHLISEVLNHWPDTPVIWVEMETNFMRIYTSHQLPANSRELVAALHGMTPAPEERGRRLRPHRRR